MNATLSIGALVASGLLAAFVAPLTADDPNDPIDGELVELRRDFHLANTLGDYDMMLSLWTDDAVFSAPPGTFVGPEAITDFLSSSPNWGTATNLTAESQAEFVRRGNKAEFAFECIIVHVDGGDPLSTSLSTLPPGAQNPDVEIVQHSNTHGMAVYEDGRWKFETFNGAGGPM